MSDDNNIYSTNSAFNTENTEPITESQNSAEAAAQQAEAQQAAYAAQQPTYTAPQPAYAAPQAAYTAPAPGSDEWQARWNEEWSKMMSAGAPAAGTAAEAPAPVPAPVYAVPAAAAPVASVKKRKMTTFWRRAVAVFVAVVLGAGFLGLGLSFGGQVANKLYPQTSASQADMEARQAFSFNTSDSQLPLSYSSQSVNLADVYNSVAQSVVSINITATTSGTSNFFFSQQPQQEQGAGSGIIYNIAGDKVYIATNNHVIADADTVTVSLDDTTQVNATFVGTNADADLAIISVAKADLDKTGIPYTAATLGDSDALRVGDVVMAVGNAMGEGKTATSGIISGLNKQITVETTTLDVIQTNAAINPGNSGGALVNSAGEVIGINTAKLSESDVEGMGYAIPINEAKDILQSLMTNGSAVKPVIGVTVQTVDQTMMDTYDFPSLGAMVMSVTPGGGAEAAGLQVYDIIVECNGAQVQSVDDLKAEIAKCKVGDTVAIKAYTAGAGGNDYVLKDYSVVLQDGNAVTPKF